jgi:hypothetical protein
MVAFVQSVSTQFAASGAQETLAFNSNVTAGNMIVVEVAASAAVTFSVSDSQSQLYNQAGSYSDASGGQRTSLWYYFSTLGGALTVKYTPSGSALTSIAIAEYSGMGAGSLNQTTTFTETNNHFWTNIVGCLVGDLVIGAWGQQTNTPSITADVGSLREFQNNGSTLDSLALCDLIASGTTAQPQCNITTFVVYSSIAASFTPGGSGPSPGPPIGRLFPVNQ